MQIIRTELPSGNRNDWKTLKALLPYLGQFPARIALALCLLILAKLASVAVPVALKAVVDGLNVSSGTQAIRAGNPTPLLVKIFI